MGYRAGQLYKHWLIHHPRIDRNNVPRQATTTLGINTAMNRSPQSIRHIPRSALPGDRRNQGLRPALHYKARTRAGRRRLLILLHGHNPAPWGDWLRNAEQMKDIADYLVHHRVPFDLWVPEYPSQLSFRTGALYLKQQMRYWQARYDLSQTVIIGFSMGGLVARQMIANGLPCKYLLTLCTPHTGILPHIPTPSAGSMSMAAWSQDLKALNRIYANERAMRKHYIAFALRYAHGSDVPHEDDWIVSVSSALGEEIGIHRTLTQTVHYPSPLQQPLQQPLGQPHSVASQLRFCKPAIDYCLPLIFSRKRQTNRGVF